MSALKRREFIAGSAAAAACACAGGCKMITGVGDTPEIPPGAYIIKDGKVEVLLSQVPSLAKVGGSVKIRDDKLSDPLIIARTGDREYAVTSLKCTHGNRELEYDHTHHKLRCVSFGHSEFGLDGHVLKGPATKPIKVYRASLGLLDRDKLVIRLD